MVTTLNYGFFVEHLQPRLGPIWPCHWLRLRAANGLAIPYVGYVEADVVLAGRRLPCMGFLVTQPQAGDELTVPGLLGTFYNTAMICSRRGDSSRSPIGGGLAAGVLHVPGGPGVACGWVLGGGLSSRARRGDPTGRGGLGPGPVPASGGRLLADSDAGA